jgi:16S rRNA (uracil1498-N3)-methyltransferase
MDFTVRKAVELGVAEIRPLLAAASVARPRGERAASRVEHWRKIARSACEQCGRHTPPLIEAPAELHAGCEALPAATRKVALDLDSAARLARLELRNAPLALAVGPEGGFSAEDWRRLDAAAFERVALGPRVLRAETAALAACSLAQSLWGDG